MNMNKKLISFLVTLFLVFTTFCNITPNVNVLASEVGGLQTNKQYNFKTVGSGKYLQVHAGGDSDGQNINQWTKDNSTEQKFRLVYNTAQDGYIFYSMSSGNGLNRVMDVSRLNNQLINNRNVQLWTPPDMDAQIWKFIYTGNGEYKIVLKYNTNWVLSTCDSNNGTGTGKSTTSPGNIFISTDTSSTYQRWKIEEVQPNYTINTGIYYIKNMNSSKYLDVYDGSTSSGANVQQFEFHGTKNQQWKISYLNNGYYKIQPLKNLNLALDVSGGTDANAANIQQYTNNNTEAQQFKILDNGDGSYRIAGKCGNGWRALDVVNGSNSNEANVVHYTYNGNSWQNWQISSCATFTDNSHDNINYDREAAKDYALEYAIKPSSPLYYRELEYDCTNFVSQALRAGKMELRGQHGLIPSNEEKLNVNNWFYADLGISYTWSGTGYFARHWGKFDGQGNLRAYQTIQYNNLQAAIINWEDIYFSLYNGDVLQYYEYKQDGTMEIYHTIIITDDYPLIEQEILYSQHTDNRKNDLLKVNINNLINDDNGEDGILIHRIAS